MKKIKRLFMNIPLIVLYCMTVLLWCAGAAVSYFGYRNLRVGAAFVPGLLYLLLIPLGLVIICVSFIVFHRRCFCPFCGKRYTPYVRIGTRGTFLYVLATVRHCPNCGKPVYPKDYDEDDANNCISGEK